MPALQFFIPGDPATLTGGYLYDQHVIDGLRALQWDVAITRLDASSPIASPRAAAAAARHLAGFPERATVVLDGLALPGLAEPLARERGRLRLVGLVHHPVALEPGLDRATAAAIERAEHAAHAALHGLICTSRWTARLLESAGVPRAQIRIVPPGTRRAPRAAGSQSATARLLAVATITPRKGHARLIDALAQLRDLDWHLDCVGSLARDPVCVAALREQIAVRDLGRRVCLHGEVASDELDRFYSTADVFVLASQLEGYGMAVAEALVRGLPIVATRAGAIAEWLPPGAARLVAVDDTAALAAALGELVTTPAARADLAGRALAAGRELPDWDASARQFGAALTALTRA